MSNVVVTGSSGFIGTNLVHALIESGENVIGIDNLSSGSNNTEDSENFKFIECDIHDFTKLKVATELYTDNVDFVFNLACPASPPKYQAQPLDTIHTNLAVENLCKLFPNAQIIHASTSEVYGDPEIQIQDESYLGNVNTLGPRACYDEGKRLAETILYEYWAQEKLVHPPVITRIFNTYGEYMNPDDGRVISNFINQALNNQDITIYGYGQQTRSFCYIVDMIDALMRIMNTKFDEITVMNLGNPETYNMNELAEKVLGHIDSESDICYTDLPENDPKRRIPDITRANEILGWFPIINLDEGLKNTINYFKKVNFDG